MEASLNLNKLFLVFHYQQACFIFLSPQSQLYIFMWLHQSGIMINSIFSTFKDDPQSEPLSTSDGLEIIGFNNLKISLIFVNEQIFISYAFIFSS